MYVKPKNNRHIEWLALKPIHILHMVVWVVITGVVFAITFNSELSLGRCFDPQNVSTKCTMPSKLMIPALAIMRI